MKVSINTDLSIELLMLTEEGKAKMAMGEPITPNDVVDVSHSYAKIRVRQNSNGKEITAQWNGTNNKLNSSNCYLSNVDIGGQLVPSLVVTIPSGTFTDNGYLWVAVETRTNNDKFEDNYQNTESLFEKTDVNYVVQ